MRACASIDGHVELCIAAGACPWRYSAQPSEASLGSCAGAITTLGRGGSDLTATLIGAALHVPEVQVWKDVDGAPPHCTSQARSFRLRDPPIENLTLCSSIGGKPSVLHKLLAFANRQQGQ